jgi:hypothetical protein
LKGISNYGRYEPHGMKKERERKKDTGTKNKKKDIDGMKR